MKESTFDLIKKIILGIIFSALLVIFVTLLILTMDNKFIKDIKNYVKTDTKVLYISNKKKYEDYPIKLFKKYDIDYKYIDSEKLSKFEKTKLKKIINNNDLSSIIVIYDSGKIKDALIHYENEEELNKFLIKNDIIPSISANISGLINKVSTSLESDSLILYIPYVFNEDINYQDNLLKSICKNYNIPYNRIDAYLLSKNQHQKINSILEISDVDDQIILFIKNKAVVGSLRGYNRKSEYINKLFEFGYIDEGYNSLNEIDSNEFEYKIESEEKNIILITKDDCKYCKETMTILNEISSTNNLDIDYINIGSIDNDISLNVEKKLQSMGYNDGFTTPLIVITEKGKILDYSIGTSSSDFYNDMFTEYGLIK